MEDYKINEKSEFDNVYDSEELYHIELDKLIEITNRIKSNFKQTLLVNAELCGLLMELKEAYGYQYHKVNDVYMGYYEYVEYCFGLSYKTCEKYLAVGKKFVVLGAENYRFTTAFEDFNISKLQELCSIEDKQLLKDLKSNKLNSSMSYKQIREYVKSLKQKKEEKKFIEWDYTFVEDKLNELVKSFLDNFKQYGLDNSETEQALQNLYDYWGTEKKEYITSYAHGSFKFYDWLYLYAGLTVEDIDKHITEKEEEPEVEVVDEIAEKETDEPVRKYNTEKKIEEYRDFYKSYKTEDKQLLKLLMLNLANIKNHYLKEKAEWETERNELIKQIEELKGN